MFLQFGRIRADSNREDVASLVLWARIRVPHTDAAGPSHPFVAGGVRSGFGRIRTTGLGLVKAAS